MSLALYRGLTRLLAPAIDRYLAARLASGKEDPTRWRERLGEASGSRPEGPLAWFHGASVGEVMSILPVLHRLRASRRDIALLITSGTATSQRLLAERLPAGALRQFAPVDRPDAVAAFLDHWRPDLSVWIESELWPNLVQATRALGRPMLLVNARLSARSHRRWRLLPGAARTLLGAFEAVLAQSDADGERLRQLGANRLTVTGNLKWAAPALPYDEAALADLANRLAGRPVWLAASTHVGEEALLAAAHDRLRQALPRALAIVVPRHPRRGPEVAALLRGLGHDVARRGAAEPTTAACTFYVADTLGELGLFYRLAAVAFVGGSLVPHGGQNPLEPARLARPVLFGPHTQNFAEPVTLLLEAGAARRVADAAALAAQLTELLADPARRQRMAEAGLAVTADAGRALDLVCEAILRHLPEERHARA
ncbi:MAG: 3-deoxy-D-manno-octulosonic acid transferase [Alphaproteobacteria bacterium]|nr:3-deoxy-D-manno-octulosonic acid transferase [Alphaproteobacteria bacterium]